jgi:peptidyl-prolyl cis-trans isomerase D
MTQYNLHWETISDATREGADHNLEVANELAFGLPQANMTAGDLLDNGDYVIVRLNRINEGSIQKLDNEQKASITQQIEATYGVLDYDLYVHSLIARAKIAEHA